MLKESKKLTAGDGECLVVGSIISLDAPHQEAKQNYNIDVAAMEREKKPEKTAVA